MPEREITKEFSVSFGAVNKILKRKRETGSVEVNRKEKCGRKKLLKQMKLFNKKYHNKFPKKKKQEVLIYKKNYLKLVSKLMTRWFTKGLLNTAEGRPSSEETISNCSHDEENTYLG